MDTDGSRSTNDEKEHKAARILLAPLIGIDKGISALLKKTLGANYADVSEEEVRDLVDALAKDEDEDSIEEQSAEMINNIFEFNDLTAADVMTHRTNIVGVDINTITLDDLIWDVRGSPFTRRALIRSSVSLLSRIFCVLSAVRIFRTSIFGNLSAT